MLSENAEFKSLALVITDEQHRFGVEQRAALTAKSEQPHVLVMSATPIPRTLALMIYGELDISVIDELPPGRTPIDTFVINDTKRSRLNNFIRKQVAEGRQVYIVCPKVEETEESDLAANNLKSAESYGKELSESIFPDLTVGIIHGKMKSCQKEAVMADFVSGKIQILVATTVIEVGVDVPNANLIVIENAERFGLSQLHQLRGRVGRGTHHSYCVLINNTNAETAASRLKIMASTNDGFKISEEDLKLRGPGDFFGSRQHGLPEMKIADLTYDTTIINDAQDAAKELLDTDPGLCLPENQTLKQRITELFELKV